nr:hypothetical protein [Fictibacillus macauensis]
MPFVIAADAAAIALGAGLISHGVYNGSNVHNTFQRIDSHNVKPEVGTIKPGSMEDFNPLTATNKQKGNYGEMSAFQNLLNNPIIKKAGYYLKQIGRKPPKTLDDKIVKGIDGLYENVNPNSKIKYIIDEAKFGSARLGKTKDGKQMSDGWLLGEKTNFNRILDYVNGDKKLAKKITKALEDNQVERILSKVDAHGNVKTVRLDANGHEIGVWP